MAEQVFPAFCDGAVGYYLTRIMAHAGGDLFPEDLEYTGKIHPAAVILTPPPTILPVPFLAETVTREEDKS